MTNAYGHQCKVKISVCEQKNANEKTHDISSIIRVFRKFLEVSRQKSKQRGKEMYKRSVLHVQSCLFPSNGTGIFFFFSPKQETGLSCTIYKPINFSLSLDMKPGTGNPSKWYRKFRLFR